MNDRVGSYNNRDNDLIRLPGSPFWNVFKRFGRDEMIALAINVAGTTLISFMTSSALLLAFVGPLVEKIGFFPAHLHEAIKQYRAIQKQERKRFLSYFTRAVKNGSVSLIEDILVHDPLYVLLFLSLSLYPGIPLWLMTSFSFLAAVVAVAWLEVGVTETRYAILKRRMKKADFGIESYSEARFFIQSRAEREVILARLQSELGLKIIGDLDYHDRYFENKLSSFSGRAPVVRLRRRTLGPRAQERIARFARMVSTGHMQTVQVVYTRPQEEVVAQFDQFRFFPVRKDKFYWFIDDDKMPDSLDKLPKKILRLIRAGNQYKELFFRRTILLDDAETLYAAIDTPLGDEANCIIELKIRKNPDVLLQAMRFVMTEFPVRHTTRTKSELPFFK